MSLASSLRGLAADAEKQWQDNERVRMCAEWLANAILDETSEFKGHEPRLAEQLRAALRDARGQ